MSPVALDRPQKVERSERIATRTADFTAVWRIERDAKQGVLLFARRENAASSAEGGGDPDKMEARSVALLASIGVPEAEIGRVVTRRLMASDVDGDQKEPSRAELLSYKTFIVRAINSVPVEGHRAVVTHAPNGELHRANLFWPALAASGHKVRPRMKIEQITERATAELIKAGEHEGKMILHWKYVPKRLESGEVVLQLVAGARIQSVRGREPREITVPVDAY